MADIKPPVLIAPLPDITLNVGADLHVNLQQYIGSATEESGVIRFMITLDNGDPLPAGLTCSPAGEFTGHITEDLLLSQPYHLLIIAKNTADVPFITYCDLIVLEAVAPEENIFEEDEEDIISGNKAVYAPEGDFNVSTLGVDTEESIFELSAGESEEDVLPGDELAYAFQSSYTAEIMQIIRDFNPTRLSHVAYQELFVEYMLRRFCSLQIYNAEFSEDTTTITAPVIETAKSGWPMYTDGNFSIATTNPHVYDTYLNRGSFVETVREMVKKAADKGWKTVGVAGFDKHAGLRLVHEHNNLQLQQPEAQRKMLAFDDIFEDKAWVQNMINNLPPKSGS